MNNCKDCCFAKIEDGIQERCLAGKYKYLQDDYHIKTEDGIFTFDRPCLYKRPKCWNESETTETKLEIARKDLFPNIGMCIQYDYSEEGLINLTDQIKNLNYPTNRLFVIFYSDFSKDSLVVHNCQKEIQKREINCLSVFKIEDNIYENETSIFKNLSDSTFVLNINSSSEVDFQKSLDYINKEFNDRLSECLVFQDKDAVFISSRYVSKSYLEFKNYSKMQNNILQKVKGTKYYQIII